MTITLIPETIVNISNVYDAYLVLEISDNKKTVYL